MMTFRKDATGVKRIASLIVGLSMITLASAQYKPIDQGSTLQFTIQNLGFDVHGLFTGFKGSINFDAQNPPGSSFDVTIDASTVNTDNGLRDDHLKGESYFDIKNYPAIRFTSSAITVGKGGVYVVTGKLTIKNKTGALSFPFTASPSGNGWIFKGSFKINRKDYDIGGTSTISNQLEVFLNVAAEKK